MIKQQEPPNYSFLAIKSLVQHPARLVGHDVPPSCGPLLSKEGEFVGDFIQTLRTLMMLRTVKNAKQLKTHLQLAMLDFFDIFGVDPLLVAVLKLFAKAPEPHGVSSLLSVCSKHAGSVVNSLDSLGFRLFPKSPQGLGGVLRSWAHSGLCTQTLRKGVKTWVYSNAYPIRLDNLLTNLPLLQLITIVRLDQFHVGSFALGSWPCLTGQKSLRSWLQKIYWHSLPHQIVLQEHSAGQRIFSTSGFSMSQENYAQHLNTCWHTLSKYHNFYPLHLLGSSRLQAVRQASNQISFIPEHVER